MAAEDIFVYQLADIDQIVTEHEADPTQFSDADWWAKLRVAVDGTEYVR